MHWVISEAQDWLALANIANAFGIVLYTDRHSNLAKVLADDLYWRGLNERTGKRWPVFVAKRPPGTAQMTPPPFGKLGMMVEVWREPKENAEILEQLGLESTRKPYLIVYSVLDDATTVVQHIEIREDSVEQAHISLKEALDAATCAIEGLSARNIKSAEGVQQALDLTFTDLRQRRAIEKALPLLKLLGKLFKQVA